VLRVEDQEGDQRYDYLVSIAACLSSAATLLRIWANLSTHGQRVLMTVRQSPEDLSEEE
jgi:hypothetical protein